MSHSLKLKKIFPLLYTIRVVFILFYNLNKYIFSVFTGPDRIVFFVINFISPIQIVICFVGKSATDNHTHICVCERVYQCVCVYGNVLSRNHFVLLVLCLIKLMQYSNYDKYFCTKNIGNLCLS